MNNRPPVRIRRNVESYDDPYISDECLPDNTVCTRCRSIYTSGRWYLKDAPTSKGVELPKHEAVCPACRKQSQRMPGGVVTLTGAFVDRHRDEILNLIDNESDRAQSVNPLERIIDMAPAEREIVITTTNEKLAQRIGRAVHKAYRGTVEYQFSGDNKVARVFWHREE